jgi:hypothetical protein
LKRGARGRQCLSKRTRDSFVLQRAVKAYARPTEGEKEPWTAVRTLECLERVVKYLLFELLPCAIEADALPECHRFISDRLYAVRKGEG